MYGPAESALTKEVLEQDLDGMSVEEVPILFIELITIESVEHCN